VVVLASAAILVLVGVACGGVVIYWWAGVRAPAAGPMGLGTSTKDKNRDYLKVLEGGYLMTAYHEMDFEWGQNERDLLGDPLDTFDAVTVLRRTYDGRYKAAENTQLEYRKLFLARHGLDSKDWKPEFQKQFPERDILFDEVKRMAGDLRQRHGTEVRVHLSKKHSAIAETAALGQLRPEFNAYRQAYILDLAPKMADEVEPAVMKMDSVVRLRKKVLGNTKS
jgi:hypothetical protein